MTCADLTLRPLRCESSNECAVERSRATRTDIMAWIILVVAGLFEVAWAIGLKYTEGFTRLWPTVWTVLAMIVSLWLLGIAMKTLPVCTARSAR